MFVNKTVPFVPHVMALTPWDIIYTHNNVIISITIIVEICSMIIEIWLQIYLHDYLQTWHLHCRVF